MYDTKASTTRPAQSSVQTALQLPPDLYDLVQTYAETHYIELSEALRYLIQAGFAAEARAMHEGERH